MCGLLCTSAGEEICVAPDYGTHCLSGNETWQARLMTDLFGTEDQQRAGTATYSPDVIPIPQYNTDIIYLDLQVYVKNVMELNDAEQTITLLMVMEDTWFDAFLKWDPEEYGGLTNFSTQNAEALWWPVLEIRTSAAPPHEGMGIEHHAFRIYNDGKVQLVEQRLVKSQCNLHVADFPFDKQSCVIELGDYDTNTYEMVLGNFALNPRSYGVVMSAWNVTNISHHNEYECYNYGGIANALTEEASRNLLDAKDGQIYCFSYVAIRIDLERYAEPYITMSIIPVAFVTLLTFISFQLPTGGGERTGLIITALLTVVAVMFITAEKLPDTRETTVLDTFNKVMVLLNLIVMIEAGIVSMLIEYKIEIDIEAMNLKFFYPELWGWRCAIFSGSFYLGTQALVTDVHGMLES
eukprot:gene16506-19600_t